MSFPTADIVLYKFISDGLNQIRAHPEIIDEIFAYFLEDPYKDEFGQRSIDQIKEWFSTNDIPVVLAWELSPQSIPCYSIHLAESSEMVESAFLSDEAGEIEEESEPRVIVTEFVPSNYNETLGIITVSDSVDLSMVYPGHIVKDAKNQLFQILSVTDQNITIDLTDAAIPDMSKALIQSFVNMKVYRRGEAYLKDSIDVGIHASLQSNIVLWLYQILLYILFRYKLELINRCMDLTTFTASDFRRDSQYLGDSVFSRWVRISARTRMDWKGIEYSQADTLIANVEVDDN